MNNKFLRLIYNKEFFNNGIINKLKNCIECKKFLKQLKKEAPDFDLLRDFAEYIRWADFIYGLNEDDTIDLIKKRNPYVLDNDGEVIEISFSIRPNRRTSILFDLDIPNKMITIDISRERISNSESKTSSISFYADKEEYSFSKIDQLMICEINRILQETMIKYFLKFYNII